MKQKVFSQRWIILVLLLVISLSFLFLQLLSLKAIDNTLISRLKVVESLQRLLLLRDHGQKNVVLRHLKIFGEVSREHGMPIFLFHPLNSSLLAQNSNVLQGDPCELLCKHQGFVFGVINSEWQMRPMRQLPTVMSQFRFNLHSRGFHAICHNVQEPWFDSSKDFLDIKLIVSSCSISLDNIFIELLIFYDRQSYLWHGPLQRDTATKIKFTMFSGAYGRFSFENKIIDGLKLRVPADPRKLASEQNHSRFTGCNLTNSQRFYSKYGRDISPDAVLFKKKAFQVLSSAASVLERLSVRFWLSSGTCLGWFRQCDIIPHSKDVDIGIWIKDYNPLLISEFKTNGLVLKHRFGRVQDSFELSFRNEEDYVKLDIFFFYEENDNMWNGGTQAKSGRKFKYTFPKFTLCWTEFLELKVRVPCETESYVMANYGNDWQVPIKEWNWKESPPNVRENGIWNEEDWGEVIQLF